MMLRHLVFIRKGKHSNTWPQLNECIEIMKDGRYRTLNSPGLAVEATVAVDSIGAGLAAGGAGEDGIPIGLGLAAGVLGAAGSSGGGVEAGGPEPDSFPIGVGLAAGVAGAAASSGGGLAAGGGNLGSNRLASAFMQGHSVPGEDPSSRKKQLRTADVSEANSETDADDWPKFGESGEEEEEHTEDECIMLGYVCQRPCCKKCVDLASPTSIAAQEAQAVDATKGGQGATAKATARKRTLRNKERQAAEKTAKPQKTNANKVPVVVPPPEEEDGNADGQTIVSNDQEGGNADGQSDPIVPNGPEGGIADGQSVPIVPNGQVEGGNAAGLPIVPNGPDGGNADNQSVPIVPPVTRKMRNKPPGQEQAYILDKNKLYVCGLAMKKHGKYKQIIDKIVADCNSGSITEKGAANAKMLDLQLSTPQ